MKLRVNGKVFDLSSRQLYSQQKLLKQWHENNQKNIECLCIEGRNINPHMHIRKTIASDKETKYSLVNNKNSLVDHHHSCNNNKVMYDFLKENGIVYTESLLKMNTNLDHNVAMGSLYNFFMFMIQLDETSIDVFKKGQKRNLSGRIYKCAGKSEINGIKLIDGEQFNLQVIRNNTNKKVLVNNFPGSPNLVIGWGNLDEELKEHEKLKFLGKLPLFSVDARKEYVCDITVKRSLIEKVKKETVCNERNGWWLIWREINQKGHLEDKEVIFIPAEPLTKIPVDSLNESRLIRELVDSKRSFKKQLLWNKPIGGKQAFNKIFLLDTIPGTIIEIAENEDQFNLLNKREALYKDMGYRYIVWKAFVPSQKIPVW